MSNLASISRLRAKSRVMIVEDHLVVLEGLTILIGDEEDLEVAGSADSPEAALALFSQLRPDVVVVDISLGDQSGLDLIKKLHEDHPKLPILALSMHDESLYAERALRAGAKGYIMKKEAMKKVLVAIRTVLRGDIHISERMALRMAHKLVDPGSSALSAPMLERLSDREFEVFNFIAQGIGPTEIAGRLGLSVKTVETHRERIKQKLELPNGQALTRFALQWSLDRK